MRWGTRIPYLGKMVIPGYHAWVCWSYLGTLLGYVGHGRVGIRVSPEYMYTETYPNVPYHTLACPTVPYRTLPYPTYHTLPYPIIPYHTLPYHIL